MSRKSTPCPMCQSNQVVTDSTEIYEEDGCGYQSMWLICEECGHSSEPVDIDDCMSDEKRSNILLNMVDSWNNAELF
jgi:RecJ-like exonuclease